MADEAPRDPSLAERQIEEGNQDWYFHGIRLKKYRSPLAQVAIVGFFAFMTVYGPFNFKRVLPFIDAW